MTRTNQFKAHYHTESDVSGWIVAALEDAKKLVQHATGKFFHVHHEFSLWSNRPDHLVLYDESSHDPIIAVEDKKPFPDWKEGDKISLDVLGQMYDYLMELRCLGHSAPFAVLSTFDQSWLFWSNDQESNEIVQAETRLKDMDTGPCADLTSPTQPAATKKKTPSPPELRNEPTMGNDNTYNATFSLCENGPRDELRQTREAYGAKQLVPLLYTAILCGLARNSTIPCKRHRQSENYSGIALMLKKDSYEWCKLQLKQGCPIQLQSTGSSTRRNKRQAAPKGTFFAVEKLGRGETSKVFDAYDHEGNRCAIKMYIKRSTDENKQLGTGKMSREIGENSCKREVERFKDLYPFLNDFVSFQLLYNIPCVVMPCFQPLSQDERNAFQDGESTIRKQVRACLSKFAEHGWKYHESDLRWRHIGYYVKEARKEMVMFDLADLEEMQEMEKKDPMALVDSHIQYLLDRLPESGPSKTTGPQNA
ncbi:MAG: hypothetical protein SGILL_007424 [Bacillariaceae sp.]